MRPHRTEAATSALANLSDESLATELKSGRSEALSTLFDRYRGPIFQVARRIVGDHGEAEEVVQQVFLETYRHIQEFDAQKSSFRSWLFRTAKRRAIDRRRHLDSQHVYEWLGLDEEDATSLRATEILRMPQQEIERLVDELLQSLSDRERMVIELAFVRGLTLPEMHKETKLTLPVLRHLYYKTIKKLRLALLSQEQTSGDKRSSTQ